METIKEPTLIQEVKTCEKCKFWNPEKVRDFKRDGIRVGLVEKRSICENPKAKSFNHLVKNDSSKACFTKGVYTPKKEKNKPAKVTKNEVNIN